MRETAKSRWHVPMAMVLAVALQGLLASGEAHAQGRYPEKVVRVFVGNPTGLPDTVARLVTQKLSESWGQQVVIDTRPGQGSIIAADALARSAPDGYSLLVSDSSVTVINPFVYAKLPYSPKSLVPVSLAATAPLFLAVHRSLPVTTLQELLALAKAQPGKLAYGSSGIGSTHHLSMEYIKWTLGLDILHVPYKGTAQSVPALVGGQVPIVFSAYPSLAPHARAGTVKLLASNASRRAGFAPDIPTVAELAIKDYDFAPSIGFTAPAGMPRDIVNKVAADIAQAVKQRDVVDKMFALGIEPVGSTPEAYAAQLKAETERYAQAIKAANVKAE